MEAVICPQPLCGLVEYFVFLPKRVVTTLPHHRNHCGSGRCTIDNQQFGNILFRRGARTLSQDLDRRFERLPLLVQRRYLQFDPCDRGD
jgi:hypothetical protein